MVMMIAISNLVIVMNEMITRVMTREILNPIFRQRWRRMRRTRRRRKKIIRVVGDISVPEVKGREDGCVVVKGGRRRRMGIGRASSSRSRLPIDGGAGGGRR